MRGLLGDASLKDCFRWALRRETHEDHKRIDTLVSTIDVADPLGLAQFIEVHLTCFDAMRRSSPAGGALRSNLGELVELAKADLATLAATPDRRNFELRDVDALALEYMLEGSRLGTQVLKARWMLTDHALVLQAHAYFSAPRQPERWQKLCARLSSIPTDSPRAVRVIHDTKRLFRMFLLVATEVIERSKEKELLAQ